MGEHAQSHSAPKSERASRRKIKSAQTPEGKKVSALEGHRVHENCDSIGVERDFRPDLKKKGAASQGGGEEPDGCNGGQLAKKNNRSLIVRGSSKLTTRSSGKKRGSLEWFHLQK